TAEEPKEGAAEGETAEAAEETRPKKQRHSRKEEIASAPTDPSQPGDTAPVSVSVSVSAEGAPQEATPAEPEASATTRGGRKLKTPKRFEEDPEDAAEPKEESKKERRGKKRHHRHEKEEAEEQQEEE